MYKLKEIIQIIVICIIFQELITKSELNSLSNEDAQYFVNLLNDVEGDSVIVDLVNQHVSFLFFVYTSFIKALL